MISVISTELTEHTKDHDSLVVCWFQRKPRKLVFNE